MKEQNGVGEIFSVQLRKLQMAKTVSEEYHNRGKCDVLKVMRVFIKEEKRVNGIDQWCIVFCHGDIKGMERYTVEQ